MDQFESAQPSIDAAKRAAEIELAWTIHLETLGARKIRVRKRLAEAQGWRCCYCGVRMIDGGQSPSSATLEHVVPRCQGGTDAEDNLVVACCTCNTARADRPWQDFVADLPVRPAFQSFGASVPCRIESAMTCCISEAESVSHNCS